MDLFFSVLLIFLLSFFSDIKHFKALKSCCRPFPCLASVFALYGSYLPSCRFIFQPFPVFVFQLKRGVFTPRPIEKNGNFFCVRIFLFFENQHIHFNTFKSVLQAFKRFNVFFLALLLFLPCMALYCCPVAL